MTPETEWARRKVRSLLGTMFSAAATATTVAVWNATAQTVLQEMASGDEDTIRKRFGALMWEMSIVAGFLAQRAAADTEGASGADMVAEALQMSASFDGLDELQLAQLAAKLRQQ